MKRIFITVAVATAALFSANAQELKFGAKAGVNFSTLSFSDIVVTKGEDEVTTKHSNGYRTGFYAGAFVEYRLSDVLFVEGGITYSNQGATRKSEEATRKNKNTGETKVKKEEYNKTSLIFNTINIPVWIKYDIAGFRPKVGVNLCYLINAKAKKEDTTIEIKEGINKYDVGILLGAEYNFPVGLFFDGSFNLGLLNLNNGKSTDDPNFTVKNRLFQIGVGYKF